MSFSLEQKLAQFDSPIQMLRDSEHKLFRHAYTREYSNWRDEQAASRKTALILDQSNHMNETYFRGGADLVRLLSDTCINSFKGWGRNKAKQNMVCAPDGNLVATAVLFGLEEDEVSVVGPIACANWMKYQAEIGNYDVEVTTDVRTAERGYATGGRNTYRYEIEGPAAWAILEKAIGGPLPEVRFFGMTEFTIDGCLVRALKHTMAGKVGSDVHGLEMWGPASEGKKVMDALVKAGEEFGMIKGGALTYYSTAIESGYLSQPVPAIYTGDDMKPYREWLSGDDYEAKFSVGGSFASDDVKDYYRNPFDMGYGHILKFDHDFIGREALEKIKDQPHKKKVWLKWNDDDVMNIIRSSLFDEAGTGAKFLDYPLSRYARVQMDSVHDGKNFVGTSATAGYTRNVGAFSSLAMIDPDSAVDGKEVVITWGEENGGTRKLGVERHVQTEIRATVSTTMLV
ncbi:aminomethyltransferase family protein [Sphingobium fuliginis]|uniref:Aminomethyl transferase family protein n=1 Tax=Sphingobium fuliginis ATCC 27551 TaxID=1208342 RepID=A0A5B8CME2_SPHSA|nr:aminomethyltransferase family protein [Sphingobium fuliginis]QDC39651.1 aminomethyl transferase family protein [Sphingobium fuliginis ATCC 27551]